MVFQAVVLYDSRGRELISFKQQSNQVPWALRALLRGLGEGGGWRGSLSLVVGAAGSRTFMAPNSIQEVLWKVKSGCICSFYT